MSKPRILVADANRAVAAEMRRHLESAEMEVETADSLDAAIQRLRGSAADVLVCGVSSLDAPRLVRLAKEIKPTVQALLLFDPGDDRGNDERVAAATADGYLVGPVKRGNVISCVRWSLKTHELLERVAALEAEAEKSLHAPYESAKAAPQADFNFLKRLLLVEIKRARRYQFPVAFLMVGIDRFRETVEVLDSKDQARIVGRLMASTVEGIRGMDHCALFAPDRLLVYLPHTGREGARTTAERLREKLKVSKGPMLTVSIGISAYEGTGDVSFGELLRSAGQSLKTAQEQGGDRIDCGEQASSPAPAPAPEPDEDPDFF